MQHHAGILMSPLSSSEPKQGPGYMIHSFHFLFSPNCISYRGTFAFLSVFIIRLFFFVFPWMFVSDEPPNVELCLLGLGLTSLIILAQKSTQLRFSLDGCILVCWRGCSKKLLANHWVQTCSCCCLKLCVFGAKMSLEAQAWLSSVESYGDMLGGGWARVVWLEKGLWKATVVEIMLKVIILTLTNGLVNSVKLYQEKVLSCSKVTYSGWRSHLTE